MSAPSLYLAPTDAPIRLRQHRGQLRAWDSAKRITAILAGTQSGKTSWLPWWLHREIIRTADPAGAGNDYLAVTASYDLFKLKLLPTLREVFEHVFGAGRYWESNRIIELADPATGLFWARRSSDRMWGRIILRSAESGGGLESATARAAIADEAGLDSFRRETWEAMQRRLALRQGRVCIGTTLYNLGWLKQTIYDPWIKADKRHPEIDVIQFDSTENPAFPAAEFARARASMPSWRFNMQYRGIYERPAGLIYDCLDETLHVIPRFTIPPSWPRFLGLDFGGVNTAAIWLAEEPGTGLLIAYREYHAGDRTAAEHCWYILDGEPGVPFCVGGSKSEDQWRREFRKGGTVRGATVALPINPPDVSSVEIQIQRVYGTIKRGGLRVFSDLAGLLGDLRDYHRAVDADGEPTEVIADESKYHHHAALRYVVSRIRREG